ncbi:MDR family MFS transporter [Propionimicrobium sp. PCR01-08-3]|uniref:MDR family MFS transporter n=1 Tax=Propionimicrobium sp. PCR01-08-3 TaxID=3052086 RepID=UPI00333F2727
MSAQAPAVSPSRASRRAARREQAAASTPQFKLSPAARNVFIGLMLGMLVSSISQTIVGPAMPRIIAELGGMEHYSWVATAAMLASACVVPIVGKLSDMFGRRGFYIAGLIVFMCGAALSGAAQSFWWLVAARAVQGLGMGTLQPLSQTVIGDIIPARSRGKYQGLMGAMFGVTSVLGPLAGGAITDHLGWRWLFYLPIPLGLVALYFIVRFLRIPNNGVKTNFDMWGTLTLVPALVAILLATSWGGGTYAWNSATIVGMYAAGAVLLAGFVIAELHADNPLLPLRMFKQNVFTLSVLSAFAMSVAMFGAIIYVPVFAQGVLGSSATNSGIILMPLSLAMIVTSSGVGLLITKFGRYKGFMITGLLVLIAGYLGLTTLNVDSSKVRLSLMLVVIGFGLGLAMQVYTLVVQNQAKRSEMGIATSAVQFFRNLGSTVGTAVLGTVMSSSLQPNILGYLSDDMKAQMAQSGQTIDAGSVLDSSALSSLPPEIAQAVRFGMADSMNQVFWMAVPFAVAALALTLFIKNTPLRTTLAPDDRVEARVSGLAETGAAMGVGDTGNGNAADADAAVAEGAEQILVDAERGVKPSGTEAGSRDPSYAKA